MSVTGSRLRELREETGKSQGEVAKLIGISRPAYVAYETGRSHPSRKLEELSNLFNTYLARVMFAIIFWETSANLLTLGSIWPFISACFSLFLLSFILYILPIILVFGG